MTYVDLHSGERTELSVVSLANAAAKIANALRDAFDLEPGDAVALDLPLHWQRSTWCAGVWTAGCVVRPELTDAPLVVTTPDRAEFVRASVTSPVAVVSMHPFGLPISEPLPDGTEDVTVAVRSQPDAYLFETPDAHSTAIDKAAGHVTQEQVLAEASSLATSLGLHPGDRLLAEDSADPHDLWLACLALPLAADTSVVLTRGTHGTGSSSGEDDAVSKDAAEDDAAARIAKQENVTARLPAPSA